MKTQIRTILLSLFLSGIFLASPGCLKAQMSSTLPFNLSIQVVNEAEFPVEFATVIVYVDDMAVSGGQTDKRGHLDMDLASIEIPKNARLQICVYHMGIKKCMNEIMDPNPRIVIAQHPSSLG
jgi:hypothetical protein